MFNTSAPSLADIAAVTGNNDGFTGNNGWWILIILFAIFGGWGNGGWGSNSAGAANNYVLASDFATLQRQIDSTTADIKQGVTSIGNGLSSLGYDQLNQMNGINTNIYAAQNALSAQLNAMQANQSQCCCENKYLMQQQTADIIANDNANYRSLSDRLTAMEMSAKDDKIAALTADNTALKFAASQQCQNTYLVNQLRPAPVPAYTVANPYAGTYYSCGCNS